MLKKLFSFIFLDREIKDDVIYLKKTDSFRMFTVRELKKITTILYRRTYMKNEILYKKDESAKLVCLLKSGKIELDDDKNKKYVETNKIFGKRFLFNSAEQYSDTAKAAEKSELYILHKEDLENLMEKDSSIGFKITRALLEDFYSKA
ncbi:cyclic nucleotide-binding domain-containing protein [Candidatus Ruminimicrobiellum ovillum]|uniref:cyclic nucleotide-binding domain-containing protein n=1 Tax=Candidatus Ruminimicrobiellum ovillum TaxID=1947927 RepID=UPI00355A77BB